MTLARRYQVAGNVILILGGFIFVAIFVLAASHPIPDWLRSTMLATAVIVFVSGWMLRGHGGLQLNLDASREAIRYSKDACETGEMMLEVSRVVLTALRAAPTVRLPPAPHVEPQSRPRRRRKRNNNTEPAAEIARYAEDASKYVELGRQLERGKREREDGQPT